jgi:hypothetical protein
VVRVVAFEGTCEKGSGAAFLKGHDAWWSARERDEESCRAVTEIHAREEKPTFKGRAYELGCAELRCRGLGGDTERGAPPGQR